MNPAAGRLFAAGGTWDPGEVHANLQPKNFYSMFTAPRATSQPHNSTTSHLYHTSTLLHLLLFGCRNHFTPHLLIISTHPLHHAQIMFWICRPANFASEK